MLYQYSSFQVIILLLVFILFLCLIFLFLIYFCSENWVQNKLFSGFIDLNCLIWMIKCLNFRFYFNLINLVAIYHYFCCFEADLIFDIRFILFHFFFLQYLIVRVLYFVMVDKSKTIILIFPVFHNTIWLFRLFL